MTRAVETMFGTKFKTLELLSSAMQWWCGIHSIQDNSIGRVGIGLSALCKQGSRQSGKI